MSSYELSKALLKAAETGHVEEMKAILRDNPSVDVNKAGFISKTSLFMACWNDHDAIVAMLLAHPDISVNLLRNDGLLPFHAVCYNGRTSSARLLLGDSRTKLNSRTMMGATPLREAAFYGYSDIIRWWIASGREMDLGEDGNFESDAIRTAWKRGKTEAATLLERFKGNPEKTRREVMEELGITGKSVVVSFFALWIYPIHVFFFSSFLEFLVSTPPKLTRDEYRSFLDSLPLHPSRVYFAVSGRELEELKAILENNPEVDLRWRNGNNGGRSALHQACEIGDPFIGTPPLGASGG